VVSQKTTSPHKIHHFLAEIMPQGVGQDCDNALQMKFLQRGVRLWAIKKAARKTSSLESCFRC
jgi:hypothetical protein